MKTALPWITEGYKVFALLGPSEIKIERLAKAVGISKSSFLGVLSLWFPVKE